MGDVLDLIGVTVVRDGATLLEDVTWTVREGERWVILGPNGAGKTTLLQIAGARMHPTRGSADVLGDRLGEVDVFELRPADRAVERRVRRDGCPRARRSRTSCSPPPTPSRAAGASGTTTSTSRARGDLLAAFGVGAPRRPHLRHAERGRAQAGPDRPVADDRPRARAARRAGRRARPRRPRGPGAPPRRARRATALAGAGARHPPRRGDPARLHPRPAAAPRPGRGRRSDRRGPDRRDAARDLRPAARGRPDREPMAGHVFVRTDEGAPCPCRTAELRSRPGTTSAHGRRHGALGDGMAAVARLAASALGIRRDAVARPRLPMFAGGAVAGGHRGRARRRPACRVGGLRGDLRSCCSSALRPPLLRYVRDSIARRDDEHGGARRPRGRGRSCRSTGDGGRVKLAGEVWRAARATRQTIPLGARSRSSGSTARPRSSHRTPGAGSPALSLRTRPAAQSSVARGRSHGPEPDERQIAPSSSLLLLVLFVIIAIVRAVRIVPQAARSSSSGSAATRARWTPGLHLADPVRRPRARRRRPA